MFGFAVLRRLPPRLGVSASNTKPQYAQPAPCFLPRRSLRLLRPQLPRKIVEHAQLIAIQIGDPELAQAPRLILRLSQDLRPSLPPAMVQFVDFVPAIQI